MPPGAPWKCTEMGAEKCKNKTAQKRATTPSPTPAAVNSRREPSHCPCLSLQLACLPACDTARLPLPEKPGPAERREANKRPSRQRGDEASRPAAFRLGLRLETPCFALGVAPPSVGVTGWVGHQPLLPLKGSQSPDVPGGQLQNAVSAAWAAPSGPQTMRCCRPLGSRSRYPPEGLASPRLQLRSRLCSGSPEHQARY